MGQQDPAVDEGRIAQLGQARPERERSVGRQDRPEDRARRPLGQVTGERARRAQAALLDQGADAAAGEAFEPGEGPCRGPAGDHELRPRVGQDPPDRVEALQDEGILGVWPGVDRAALGPEQDQVEWRVEVDTEAMA